MIYSPPEQVEAEQRERALESLLDIMERGEEFPPRPSHKQINRLEVLCLCDQALLAEAVEAHLRNADCWPTFNYRMFVIMRDYLRDGEFHQMMLWKIRDDEREEAETAEADSKRRMQDGF